MDGGRDEERESLDATYGDSQSDRPNHPPRRLSNEGGDEDVAGTVA